MKKRKKFIPPTLAQVIDYAREKGLRVDARKFINYYEASDPPWRDRDSRPVRNWKMKLIAVWDKSGEADRSCRYFYGKGKGYCGKLGVYTTVDDGKVCWWCEQHKPKEKVNLPVPNPLKRVPQPDNRSVSDKVNEQLARLKGK